MAVACMLLIGVGNSGDGNGDIDREKVVLLQLLGERMVSFLEKYKMVAP